MAQETGAQSCKRCQAFELCLVRADDGQQLVLLQEGGHAVEAEEVGAAPHLVGDERRCALLRHSGARAVLLRLQRVRPQEVAQEALARGLLSCSSLPGKQVSCLLRATRASHPGNPGQQPKASHAKPRQPRPPKIRSQPKTRVCCDTGEALPNNCSPLAPESYPWLFWRAPKLSLKLSNNCRDLALGAEGRCVCVCVCFTAMFPDCAQTLAKCVQNWSHLSWPTSACCSKNGDWWSTLAHVVGENRGVVTPSFQR